MNGLLTIVEWVQTGWSTDAAIR